MAQQYLVAPPCRQASRIVVRTQTLYLDPFFNTVEDFPPAPRPPDPPPPVITPPYVPPHQIGATFAWSGLDAFWWTCLVRANNLTDPSILQRTLAARGDFRNFTQNTVTVNSVALQSWFCQMSDRFYVGLQGTQNLVQVLQYMLTHAVGAQQFTTSRGWYNLTFFQQAAYQDSLIRPVWQAAGSPPLCIIGHSYGGAVAAPLLAGLRNGLTMNQFDRLVTFGQPRNCTPSALALLNGSLQSEPQIILFANAGDPIPYLPPPQSIMQIISSITGQGTWAGGDYALPAPQIVMQPSGGAVTIPVPSLSQGAWIEYVLSLLNASLAPANHLAVSYGDLALEWFNQVPLNETASYANYNALYGVLNDLEAAGV